MTANKFPFTIKCLDPKLDDKVKSLYLGQKDGSVEIGPKKYVFNRKYGQVAEKLYDLEVRPDDIWVVTLPRSGTTVTQEMIGLILNKDYDTATNVPMYRTFSFLEASTFGSDYVIEEIRKDMANDPEMWANYKNLLIPQWEVVKDTPSRRYIKSHVPLSLLPPTLFTSGAKVIYVARNPKNVSISRYHQDRSLRVFNFVGEFDEYWDLFENGLIQYLPYWEHIEEGWQRRNDDNFLFLFYEDITKDYEKTIIQVSNFLGKTMSNEEISKLANYLDIDNFRKNVERHITPMYKVVSTQDTYQHVRSGKSGNWSEYFSGNLNKRANQWIEENYKNTTLRFPIILD